MIKIKEGELKSKMDLLSNKMEKFDLLGSWDPSAAEHKL
jgi:hypothetical protein